MTDRGTADEPGRPGSPSGRLDTVVLQGITAKGHHGVFAQERRDGQPFVVDLVLHLELQPAGTSDDLSRTAHYGELAQRVHDIIGGEPFELIEALAETIATDVLGGFPVESVDVTVHKPRAPIPVPFGDVAVTVRRSRP
ncbi:dihydroneopterin aldolase [Arthrobacter echini]|uniref:7,8-dihydroneopterin aldolase n=1 Tax=Arthrobacter echini TaxID=1529066 RepID=A0A4S5E1F4_9MICC|nr:dihydroneopterin aldolase [Arthrobacter echini]THJ65140.1 dihydroneopterin aldolase [Arthrobacter echini]